MRRRASNLSVLLAVCTAFGFALPSLADWRTTFTRQFVAPMVKRAAVRLIQREVYDLESSGQSYPPARQPRPSAPVRHSYQNPKPLPPEPEQFAMPPKAVPSEDTDSDVGPSTAREQNYPDYFSTRDVSAPAIRKAFVNGTAGAYSYRALVSAGAVSAYPMKGGTYKRNDRVKYIILHSTETGSPADAKRVIRSWSNRGTRHPGAQFVVDRDGTVYATTDPEFATVHINTSKTLAGYSNDNSVGIEIVRAGTQQYTAPQLASVVRLVSYLQDHFHVSDSNITTHHHVQPSDRSDPVNFNMTSFLDDKANLRSQAIAWKPRGNHLSQKNIEPDLNNDMPPPAPEFHRVTKTLKTAPEFSNF